MTNDNSDALAGCQGKHPYLTYTAAKQVAKKRRRIKEKAPIQPYKCRYCGYFHIGNREKMFHD